MTKRDTAPYFDDFNLTLRWVSLAELTADAELSCIDGRHTGCVLGAPGGDAGEFILMLGGLEAVGDRRFDRDQVQELLEHYMDRHGRFYMHTDRHALDALTEALRGDEALSQALDDAGSIDALVNQPPQSVRSALVEQLVAPKHVGCGHLKTMLSYTDEFDVRKALVEDTIRAFYRALWWGRIEANLTILEGDHEESAIINFETEDALEAQTEVPSVCASAEGPYIFANHEAARRYKRERDLDLLAEMPGVVPEDKGALQKLRDDLEALAEKQAAATVSHLAPDLPAYSVTFSGREVAVDLAE